MRACAFVSEIWRRKQVNLSKLRCYEDSRQLHSSYRFVQSPFKAIQEITNQPSVLHNTLVSSSIQQCRFFSFASSHTNENETVQPANNASQSVKRRRRGTKRTKFSDSESDSESNLSRDELVNLLSKKKELLTKKQTEMEIMQEKFLMSYTENNNVVERTKREAENSKKFAIQSFAKSLLDVADNLGRASSVVKDGFIKIETSEDPVGALPLLKTLMEGVEMTEKQLSEVFKKFGVEKYDPENEEFDPNRHNAVFQVPDPSKPPNTVAVVMKSGYMLHERIIRPAEVGVVVEEKETN